jgi:hypothetical protein
VKPKNPKFGVAFAGILWKFAGYFGNLLDTLEYFGITNNW